MHPCECIMYISQVNYCLLTTFSCTILFKKHKHMYKHIGSICINISEDSNYTLLMKVVFHKTIATCMYALTLQTAAYIVFKV